MVKFINTPHPTPPPQSKDLKEDKNIVWTSLIAWVVTKYHKLMMWKIQCIYTEQLIMSAYEQVHSIISLSLPDQPHA